MANPSAEEEGKQKSFSESVPKYVHSGARGKDMMFWVAVGFAQSFGIISIALVAYLCTLYGGFSWKDAKLQFNYHPLMMILGLVFCYGNAILTYRVLHNLPKMTLKIIHFGLHTLAIIFASIALAAVFENHRRLSRPDLYSLHSWVGLGTFIAFCLQYLGSFAAFLFPGFPGPLRAYIMPYHIFFGIGLFILAIATSLMGITELLFFLPNYSSWVIIKEGAVGNSLGFMLLLFGFLVVYTVTQSKYKRVPLPDEVPNATSPD